LPPDRGIEESFNRTFGEYGSFRFLAAFFPHAGAAATTAEICHFVKTIEMMRQSHFKVDGGIWLGSK
jgi:hypothetical protein